MRCSTSAINWTRGNTFVRITEHEYQRADHNKNERIWKLYGFWKSSTCPCFWTCTPDMWSALVLKLPHSVCTILLSILFARNQFRLLLLSIPFERNQFRLYVCFCRDNPQWARVSSFTRFLDHTQRRNTVGRAPLDEWSARRRDIYLTINNTHNRQTSIRPVGFEPTISAGDRPTP